MRNLLALLGLILVTAGLSGYYLGWYKVKSTTGSEGNRTISIDLNTTKIGEDLARGVSQIEKAIDKKSEGDSADSTQSGKTTPATSTAETAQTKPGARNPGSNSKNTKG